MNDFSDFLSDGKREDEPKPKGQSSKRRTTALVDRNKNHVFRRATSTVALLEAFCEEPKDGTCYHVLTHGDVDGLSYLQLVLAFQPLDHCLFSTWCMAGDDILALAEYLDSGRIKKLDAYVGEIFPTSYAQEWRGLNDIFEKHQCGRIAVARNHSKIWAGTGPKFSFACEMSCNINTNPRIENGCLTIGHGAYEFYKQFFDGIVSIK